METPFVKWAIDHKDLFEIANVDPADVVEQFRNVYSYNHVDL